MDEGGEALLYNRRQPINGDSVMGTGHTLAPMPAAIPLGTEAGWRCDGGQCLRDSGAPPSQRPNSDHTAEEAGFLNQRLNQGIKTKVTSGKKVDTVGRACDGWAERPATLRHFCPSRTDHGGKGHPTEQRPVLCHAVRDRGTGEGFKPHTNWCRTCLGHKERPGQAVRGQGSGAHWCLRAEFLMGRGAEAGCSNRRACPEGSVSRGDGRNIPSEKDLTPVTCGMCVQN